MTLPDAPWRTEDGMRRLLEALDAAGGRTRFVGGAVRDTLLGLPASDVDLATRLAPEEMLRRLERAHIKAVPTGIAHGTVTAVVNGRPVEVTTLRRDVSTDGRRATVAYTEDWREDAARRDFTINALSADPESGAIFDYFGGLADLDERRVRFIGDPFVRIAEDHLRILRFFRFHARFGLGAPDEAAVAACAARANDLMALSRERIADELLKLLALPAPLAALRLMVDRAILAPVLPEIGRDGLDALDSLLVREAAAGAAPEPVRRLAALLPADPAVAETVAARLRLSRRAVRRLAAAAARQPADIGDPRALAYAVGTEEAADRLLLGTAPPEEIARKTGLLAGWTKPRLPIGGGDLIAMGLEPGPVVARTLRAIEQAWIAQGFPADETAVRRLARTLLDQRPRDSQ